MRRPRDGIQMDTWNTQTDTYRLGRVCPERLPWGAFGGDPLCRRDRRGEDRREEQRGEERGARREREVERERETERKA